MTKLTAQTDIVSTLKFLAIHKWPQAETENVGDSFIKVEPLKNGFGNLYHMHIHPEFDHDLDKSLFPEITRFANDCANDTECSKVIATWNSKGETTFWIGTAEKEVHRYLYYRLKAMLLCEFAYLSNDCKGPYLKDVIIEFDSIKEDDVINCLFPLTNRQS